MSNININVSGGTLPQNEIDFYVNRACQKYPNRHLSSIDIKVDENYVDLTYHWESVPFERIRRITGYLVGTLDRFNNAKKAEESDRVKHNVTQ